MYAIVTSSLWLTCFSTNFNSFHRTLYQAWIDKSDSSRQEAHDKAPGPEVTTDAIKHAMTSTKPKTRYVVANVKGTPAWVLAFLGWFLPDRVKDVIVQRF